MILFYTQHFKHQITKIEYYCQKKFGDSPNYFFQAWQLKRIIWMLLNKHPLKEIEETSFKIFISGLTNFNLDRTLNRSVLGIVRPKRKMSQSISGTMLQPRQPIEAEGKNLISEIINSSQWCSLTNWMVKKLYINFHRFAKFE